MSTASDRQAAQLFAAEAAAGAGADTASQEAVGWNQLCDQYAGNLVRLESELSETSQRSRVIEEEMANRLFIYQGLMFGITGQASRLSSHFSSLMEDVRALQANHDKLMTDKSTHANQLAEYHAQLILEQRSQAETQSQAFQNRIDNFRNEERDLRIRVESLRQEASESHQLLERRRHDSLEERRALEGDLQRLTGEVSNQKYFLERLNAQVESAKLKVRESERAAYEASSAASMAQAGAHAAAHLTQNLESNSSLNASARRLSPSPHDVSSRSGSNSAAMAMSTGVSQVQAVRIAGADESFQRLGFTPMSRLSPSSQMVVTTPGVTTAAAQQVVHSASTPVSNRPIAAASGFPMPVSLQPGSSASMRAAASPIRPVTTSGTGGAGGAGGDGSTPMSRAGFSIDQPQPSQWQMRLQKLQGELKSLKSDLGVQSPGGAGATPGRQHMN